MAGPESKIQTSVVDYARDKYRGKLIARKNAKLPHGGTNGYPDYEFNAIHRHTWFIEFKAPGEPLTELQMQRKKELEALGYSVYRCDDKGQGRVIVDSEMYAATHGGKHAKKAFAVIS